MLPGNRTLTVETFSKSNQTLMSFGSEFSRRRLPIDVYDLRYSTSSRSDCICLQDCVSSLGKEMGSLGLLEDRKSHLVPFLSQSIMSMRRPTIHDDHWM